VRCVSLCCAIIFAKLLSVDTFFGGVKKICTILRAFAY